MPTVTYTRFSKNLKTYLKAVYENPEPLIVTTPGGKNDVVVLSVPEYDSLIETLKITANTSLMAKIRRSEQ
ncbi:MULTISPECIES: type II toxin-antitoxin system Phd/YefM family antitoxin [Levilactobacillus]|uniref:type II toxin-antitoxin system Phd/YefM family antitoxin n=1 Tax=Levilactobacillus TaxID=2767886 RepID=UPI0019527FEC|nr:type II toxin-antitoxin system Phd/YefM family antitoxin [Levilactobacillus sp. 244-2]